MTTDTTDTTGRSTVLRLDGVSVHLRRPDRSVPLVRDATLQVRSHEIVCLVGESGSGKSVTARSIMGLMQLDDRIDVQGTIEFEGEDLVTAGAERVRKLRGRELAMVFQEPLSSLDPVFTVGFQLAQALRRRERLSRKAEQARMVELLADVGIRDGARVLGSYPHQLSGGMCQRVMIAMALAARPRLLIADEPTTALDVTVQQQVVDLLNELRRELGFAMVFVSHDLALVAQLAHRITVMYAGQVVEQGTTSEVLTDPRHEYTRGLLGSVLSIESGAERLHQVQGTVPSPRDFVAGDRFAPRSVWAGVGQDVRPDLRLVPGTTHSYASTDVLEAAKAKEAGR